MMGSRKFPTRCGSSTMPGGSTVVSRPRPQQAHLHSPAQRSGTEKLASIPFFKKGFAIAAAIVLTVTLLAGSAHAILLTPPAKKGKFSLGATELWYHRDQEWTDNSGTVEDKYNLGAFFAKYGVSERTTVFVEFALWNGDPHRQGISYRHINLGVGANVIVYRKNDIDVSLLLNYFENFQHDNQESSCHIMTQHVAALVQITQTYTFSQKHEAAVWFAPAYIKDSQTFDGGACPSAKKETVDNIGFTLGVNFLFWERLELFTHIVYADYFQPRLGVGYQF